MHAEEQGSVLWFTRFFETKPIFKCFCDLVIEMKVANK